MDQIVSDHIQRCMPCVQGKSPNIPERAPMLHLTASQPMELVSMDFLGLEESKGKFQYVLVITDVFTKYAWAIPTRNQTAVTTFQALFDQFLVHYGFHKSFTVTRDRSLRAASFMNSAN